MYKYFLIKIDGGADGEIRTPTDHSIRPSSARVYQFHHIGMLCCSYSDFLSPASGIVSGELVAAGFSKAGITDRDFSLVDIIPKVREVIINNVAIAVVILVKKFPGPELPNIV